MPCTLIACAEIKIQKVFIFSKGATIEKPSESLVAPSEGIKQNQDSHGEFMQTRKFQRAPSYRVLCKTFLVCFLQYNDA
jgi:hypothetical protein